MYKFSLFYKPDGLVIFGSHWRVAIVAGLAAAPGCYDRGLSTPDCILAFHLRGTLYLFYKSLRFILITLPPQLLSCTLLFPIKPEGRGCILATFLV